jgi:hypothetical protein
MIYSIKALFQFPKIRWTGKFFRTSFENYFPCCRATTQRVRRTETATAVAAQQ